MTRDRHAFPTLVRAMAAAGLVAALLAGFVAQPMDAAPDDDDDVCKEFPFLCSRLSPTRTSVAVAGVDGGGVISTPDGEAHFALFATQVTLDQGPPLVIGQVSWLATNPDGSSITLSSIFVDEYGWTDGTDGGRWARGLMSVNGEGAYPFHIMAIDGGPPGAGSDTVRLAVGGAVEGETPSDFSYEAEGRLTSGGLQILAFDEAYLNDPATPPA